MTGAATRPPPLRPFDPMSPARTWVREEYGLIDIPTFDESPVGSHRYTATVCLLYRLYDADRQPLYIGVTTAQPTRRWMAHRGTSPWWRAVRFVSLQAIPPNDRLDIERQAILTERPRFNVVGLAPRVRTTIRLDQGPKAVVAQLRSRLFSEDFAALARAFADELVSLPPPSTSDAPTSRSSG